MKEIIKLSLSLALVGMIAGLALSTTYSLTKDQIIFQQELAIFEAQKELFPEADNFAKQDIEKVEIGSASINSLYHAKTEEGFLLGHLVNVGVPGYGGIITIVIGFDQQENLQGVQVTNHSETPGLGANITRKDYLQQFSGKPMGDPFELNNDVKPITASTITVEALIRGIRSAISFMESDPAGGSL